MKLKSLRFTLVILLTFIIIFLMNYIGNSKPDALQSALLNGFSGAVGLFLGMLIFNKAKKDSTKPPDFD